MENVNKIQGKITLHDKQILDDHRIFHAWWSYMNKTKQPLHDKRTGKIIDRKEIAKRHMLAVSYMLRNGFSHRRVSKLDDTLPNHLKNKSEGFNDKRS